MAPTGNKSQPSAGHTQRSIACPSYVDDYVNRYSSLHGYGYSARANRLNTNVTPSFTPYKQSMTFAGKKPNVQTMPTNVSINHESRSQGGKENYDLHESGIKEVAKFKERKNLQIVDNERKQNEVREHHSQSYHYQSFPTENKRLNQLQSPLVQNKTQNNDMALMNEEYQYNRTTSSGNGSKFKTINEEPKTKPMSSDKGKSNVATANIRIGKTVETNKRLNQLQSPLVQNKTQNNDMALMNKEYQYNRTTSSGNGSKLKTINEEPKTKPMSSEKGKSNVATANIRIGKTVETNKINFLKNQKGSQQQSPKPQIQEPLKRCTKNNTEITTLTKPQDCVDNVKQLRSPPTQANSVRSNLEDTHKQQSIGNQTSTYRNQSPQRHLSLKSQPARGKLVANQVDASHGLSANAYDKSKIMAQNDLTKSAVSNYASALYDTAKKPSAPPVQTSKMVPRLLSKLPTVQRNVEASLDCDDYKQSHLPNSRDPCIALDKEYDSESMDDEEEYVCEPFYLPYEKKTETKQSKCIRFQEDRESTLQAGDDEEDVKLPMYYKPKSIVQPSLFSNVPAYLNFSCHTQRGPKMPPALHKVVKWKLGPYMPKIVRRIVLNSGFRIIKNTTDWMAVWEKHMKSPGFQTIRSHQKYNHLPGSFRIGRKDSLWLCIKHNIKKYGGSKFGFMQKSFIMPEDLESLRKTWPKGTDSKSKWIVKPPASARGTGIRVVNKWSQFPKNRRIVVQKYIEKPLLINDNKFDLRIYVLVTSINPLRIYMYKDGLARFAAEKYSPEIHHMGEKCIHLTNYSINKFSEKYTINEDFNLCQGHKWTLKSLWSCLEARKVNTKRLWATLRDLVIKAIISGESGMNSMYQENVNLRYNCFELYGFDILLDENVKPWLLEVNISPSLHSGQPIDRHIKGQLIQAVLNTALYQVPPKLTEKAQKELCQELNLSGHLCYDKRIYETCLSVEEVRKHDQFTHQSVKCRKDYLNHILDDLKPDDIRCLIIAEDEYARCNPMERIFPTVDSHKYLKFTENPRYYNRLMDAWENKYGRNRSAGIELLRSFCEAKVHLEVTETANEKEPNVELTAIDMLHARKDDDDFSLNIPTIYDFSTDSL